MSLSKRLFYILGIFILLAAPFLIYFKAQAITDWWQLRGYTAPAAVSSLATQDTMTLYARHVFYVNHPQIISNVSAFRQSCPEAEQAIVLGCYHPNQDGIFVYQVSDPQLDGVEQVTSAHEMLHAAYDRLNSKDKKYVDGLLLNYYNNDLTDQRIKAEIDGYKQTEPTQLVNEMHSIFGTEVVSLPTPLENYYKRYFVNRLTVTDFAASYQGEFTSRQEQISADDSRLTNMKQQIESEEASLTAQSTQIDSDRAKLDSEKAAGQIDVYNAGVDNFNSEVDVYNAGVEKLQASIAAYNSLVNQRNQIAQALASLSQAIDTRLKTQSGQ